MAIGGFNNTNCVFALAPSALFNHAPQTAPFNSGTAYPYQGPQGGGITAVLTNMTSRYGYPGNPWLRFDGVDDHVVLNNFLAHSNTSKCTIEGFGHFSGTQDVALYTEADGSENRMYCYITSTGIMYWLWRINSVNNIAYTASAAVSVGAHHFAWVKDGTTLKMYLDGNEVSYAYRDSYSLGSKTFSTYSRIGTVFSPYGKFWATALNWAAVHASALSPADIAAHYALGAHFGGIRGTISGSDMLLRAATADAPSGITGLVRSGDCTAAGPLVQRGEYNCANESNIAHHLSGANAPASLFSNCSQEDGGDLVFTLLDGTEVPADVRSFSKAGQTCDIVICLPAVVANTDTTIYWQCGGSAGHRTATMAQVYPNHVFRHTMDEASGNLLDKLGNYDGTPNAYVVQGQQGLIDKCVVGDGVHQAVINLTNDIPELNHVEKQTSSFWLKPPITPTDWCGFHDFYIDAFYMHAIHWGPSYGYVAIVRDGSTSPWRQTNKPDEAWAQFWHHVVFVYDGSQPLAVDRGKIIVNGEDLPLTGTAFPTLSADLRSATHRYGVVYLGKGFNWNVDEAACVLMAPSVDFVKSQYYNQRAYAGNGAWDIGECEAFGGGLISTLLGQSSHIGTMGL